MAYQGAGGGGGPRTYYFDRARQKRYYYESRTNEYIYEDGYRIPAAPAPSPSDPRTPNPYVSKDSQEFGASQYGQPGAMSPSSEPQYVHNTASEQPSGSGRRQSRASILEQDMENLNISRPPAPSTRQYDDQYGMRITEVQNPQSQVLTRTATHPRNLITDPALFQSGFYAQQLHMATGSTQTENLYSNYRLQSRGFFKVGRVFLVLWAEPAGESHSRATVISKVEPSDRSIFTGAHNTRVYSKVRRFVVIREGDNYCSALPITTYGGQGVSKSSVKKAEHAIIYTGREAPQAHPSELPTRQDAGGMRPIAIRVTPDEKIDTLDPMSRIDFGKIHTIQHNLKVRPLGLVHPHYLNALQTQWANVWGKTTTPSPTPAVAGSSRSRNPTQDPTARSTSKQPARSRQRRPKEAARAESDDEGSEAESDDGDDSSEDGNRPQQTRPALPTQTPASSGVAQVPWAERVQNARNAYNRRLQAGYTPTQAVREMIAGLERNGKSREEAEAEIRALLYPRQS